MGAEYCCYGSDVTCSFPANGKFTEQQRGVYQGVLNAQVAVYDMLRPGVSYVDCHRGAEKEVLRALVDLSLVVPGDRSLEELVEYRHQCLIEYIYNIYIININIYIQEEYLYINK